MTTLPMIKKANLILYTYTLNCVIQNSSSETICNVQLMLYT